MFNVYLPAGSFELELSYSGAFEVFVPRVFGEDHLNHIVSCFVEYYNTLRPHQGVENVPLAGTVPEEQTATVDPDEVVCKEWLGGVLKHYARRAA